jgi:hypothetical protein
MSGPGLADRLRDASSSGPYRVEAEDDVVAAARSVGIVAARVPVAGVGSKQELLRRFAGALGFPDWFGANWDALEDCLTDLSWRPAEGYLLILEGVSGLEDLGSEDREMLLDILQASARFWAGQGTPFFAVFVDPGRQLALPDLLAGHAR